MKTHGLPQFVRESSSSIPQRKSVISGVDGDVGDATGVIGAIVSAVDDEATGLVITGKLVIGTG